MQSWKAGMEAVPCRARRGTALMLVMIMVLILTGLAASLMLIVRSAAAESSSIVHYGQTLEVAEIGESQALSSAVLYPPKLNGSEWEGFVEGNLDAGKLDMRSLQGKLNPQTYAVRIRSAYLAQQNQTIPAGFLAPQYQ